MPIYEYEHPDTGEIFQDIRTISKRDELYTAPDGKKCKRLKFPTSVGYCGRSEKDREGFELDRDFYKRNNPKYVRFRDGHRERYDPSKHQ